MKRAFFRWTLFILVSCIILPTPVPAYDPPTDTAGPLSVRIDGPKMVTATDKPLPVRVLIENKSDRAVEGSVQLQLIDRWQAEPAGPMRFSVDGQGTTSCHFKVVAGKGTYNAHYPIHADVRFEAEGKEFSAHPILILQTKLLRDARTFPMVAWQPVAVQGDSELALWRVPVRRAVVQVFGERPQTMPVGWEGAEPESRASFQPGNFTLGNDSRSTLGMHPPWHEGRAGTILVEFPLMLPKAGPMQLRYANAVAPTGEGDGVTFRVRALPFNAERGEFGKIIFERYTSAKTWRSGEVDLSGLAGKTVRLQLESHPGPKNNTAWDQSYWAEPTLIVGTPPRPAAFPPGSEIGSRVLGEVGVAVPATAKREDIAVPATAKREGVGAYEVRVWPGRRGLLDAVVGFRRGSKRLYFQGFEVRVLGGRIDDARSPILLKGVEEETGKGFYQARHRFEGPTGAFDLVGRLAVDRGVLRAKFRLENAPPPRPWWTVHLQGTAAGSWSNAVGQVYAGHGNVIRDPQALRLDFDGHRLATSFVGFDFDNGISLVQAVDVPPDHLEVQPSRRHYSLHAPHDCTLTFIPCENVFDGVRLFRETNDLKASGGVEKLAGRFVFDLWRGNYADSHKSLDRAFRYGLTDAAVIWHNWQRWGYDYRLPDVYPANRALGTHDELRRMIDACKRAGVLFALHDNYVDFYPDAEGFSYEKRIALNRNGTPMKAWLNEGRNARSYRYRADQVTPFLRRNLWLIHHGLAPNAYFIDVWSSIRPYDYWAADGTFFDRVTTRNIWGQHFAWIRNLLGSDSPQISESGHDQLIGQLDGAQANHLRVGTPVEGSRNSWCVWNVPCADAERIPWFDAAHHDRFVLHGAGYPGRYEAGLDARLHGIYSDDYIATEVLTGHPAMVSQPFGRDVVRKYWLLHDLMRALALQQIDGVEFADDDLHRQHVTWSGGGEVWVNRGETDWEVAGEILPQYGFVARVRTPQGPVEASISRRDGIIVERSASPSQIYVNGRRVADVRLAIRTSVEKVRITEGKLRLSLVWQLDVPVPDGYRPFLHLVDNEGEIVFQVHQPPASLLSGKTGKIATTAVGSLPEGTSPGDSFELRYGFYRPDGIDRLMMTGPDDGTRRIRAGTVRIEGVAGSSTGAAWTPHKAPPDLWLARQNPAGKPIDFGPIVTAGGCRLTLDGRAVRITPLPSRRGVKLVVRLKVADLPWQLPELTHIETIDDRGKVTGRRPVAGGAEIVVQCEPGTFAYRLVGGR